MTYVLTYFKQKERGGGGGVCLKNGKVGTFAIG